MTAALIILHSGRIASRSPKGEGFTDPLLGTLNFLEAYAALTGGLFPKITRDIVREKLIDSIAVITGAPAWLVKLREAVTSETTFQYLRQFARKEKAAIQAVVSARAALTID